MACEPPPFMPYEPFLLGVGVVFNLLIQLCCGAFLLAAEAFLVANEVFYLQLKLFYLQLESASNKNLNGL